MLHPLTAQPVTPGMDKMSSVFVGTALGWTLIIVILTIAAKIHPVIAFLLAFLWECIGFDGMTMVNLLNL